jgi:iron complex outermembrane receptor protein
MSYKNYMADWSQWFAINGTQPFNIYQPVHGLPNDSVPVFDHSKPLRERAGSNIVGQSYTGLYVQDEIRFLEDRIRLTLAGRYTTVKETQYGVNSNDEKFTPRVGLSVSIDKSSSVYALYDEAFVPQTGTDYSGKAFDPITGNNTELGVKKDWFGGRWNTTLSAYRITKNNVLTADPEHAMFSVQLGQTQTQGMEFDVRGEIIHGLNLTLNYAYTDSKVTKDTDPKNVGIAVPGSTKHITNGWLSYRFSQAGLRGLGISMGYQYQNGRSSWYVFDGTDQSLPDYFRLDGSVSWQSNRYSVALNVNNILNAYLYSGAPYGGMYYWQTEAPRNLRVTVGYKF